MIDTAPTRHAPSHGLSRHAALARLGGLIERPEAKVAALVGFAGIEHGDDPRFLRSLDHYVESWLGEREVYRLPGPRLLVLVPAEGAAALDHGITALARVLRNHGFGALDCRRYDLEREAPLLLAAVAPAPVGPAGAPHPLPTATPVPATALGHLLEAERALHGADIASLLRERPVWAFPAKPNEAPQPVVTELAVALDELGTRLGLPLAEDRWLTREMAPLLDHGLLRHVARDRGGDARPLSFDLHTVTVLDPAFRELAAPIPGELRRRLTIELPAWEAELSPERFAAAAEALDGLGFAVALDAVPLDGLAAIGASGPDLRFVKTMWPSHAGAEAGEALKAGVSRFGAGRLVLGVGDVRRGLDAGIAAGVALFQGRAADAEAVARTRSVSRLRSMTEVEEESADAGAERGSSLLGRLLGGGE